MLKEQGITTFIKNIDNTPQSGNTFSASKFVLSNLDDYSKQVGNSPMSIKIVSDGMEQYTLDNREYKLEKDSYLVVNEGDEFELNINTKGITKGICIYPPQDLIDEVFNYRLNSEKVLLEAGGQCDSKIRFTHKKNQLNSTRTGEFLRRHMNNTSCLKDYSPIDFNNLYINLVERLVDDQLHIDSQLKNLSSTKKQTKEELYRRISLARDYIHANYRDKILIDELSAIACLSKYHFLRSFRDFYKCTPYQYILRLKLDAAQHLICKGYSYVDISERVGFSDPKNLRKALRKFS